MPLKVLKALWGMTGPLEEQLRAVALAGYDGVEARIDRTEDLKELKRLLCDYKLDCVALVVSKGQETPEVNACLSKEVEQALTLEPIAINSHGGRDRWTMNEHLRFFEHALNVEDAAGVTISHETHRKYSFYFPPVAGAILRHFPELKLTADFAHWVVVCETMLEEHAEDVALACERAHLIHGRVGYPEGPQVPDPRAPEYAMYVAQHKAWWDAILKHQLVRGMSQTIFTSEYGPPPYLHLMPYTQQPVADMWELGLDASARFRAQYAAAVQDHNVRMHTESENA